MIKIGISKRKKELEILIYLKNNIKINELKKLTKLRYSALSRHLKNFKDKQFISIKRRGYDRFIIINRKNILKYLNKKIKELEKVKGNFK